MKKQKVPTLAPDEVAAQLAEFARRFPHFMAEGRVDFEKFRQFFSGDVLLDEKDRYTFSWAGRRRAYASVTLPVSATLVPLRDQSVDFDGSRNLFIEGDNLEALRLLGAHYRGKIKMIYIDPPYNTGKDFIYRDNWAQGRSDYFDRIGATQDGVRLESNPDSGGRFHSNWLSMMYPRLFLARQLLSDDGVMFVSIDDNEQPHLRLLMNQLFGEENFVANIAVINNLKGRNDKINVAITHEYLLIYQKRGFSSHGIELTDEQLKKYKYEDDKGHKYALRDLRKRGRPDKRSDRPNMFFPVYYNEKSGVCSLKRMSDQDVEILPLRGDKSDGVWRWGKETTQKNLHILHPRYSQGKDRWDIEHRVYLNPNVGGDMADELADDEDAQFQITAKPKSVWWGSDISSDVGNREFKELFSEIPPDYHKSPYFIDKMLQMATKGDDIVLDFFAGSGTTGQAVMARNKADGGTRQYILVQIPESTAERPAVFAEGYKTISDIAKERLRRAMAKYGASEGFKAFALAPSNYNLPAANDAAADGATPQTEQLAHDNPLAPHSSEEKVIYEIILKAGFSLNSAIAREGDFYVVTDDSREDRIFVTFTAKLDWQAVDALALHPHDLLVCLDSALGDEKKINFRCNFQLWVI